MSWSSAKKMLKAIIIYCCVAFLAIFVQIYSLTLLRILLASILKDFTSCWMRADFLSLQFKRGEGPLLDWRRKKICYFLNGHVLPWISWIWGGSQNYKMGISWKGSTLGNCFFCFYNSVLSEDFSFKAILLLQIWMRFLPVPVWDALDRNICRNGLEESGDCLTTCLIQGAQLKHTFLPWVAFFQRHFNDSGAQAPLISSCKTLLEELS